MTLEILRDGQPLTVQLPSDCGAIPETECRGGRSASPSALSLPRRRYSPPQALVKATQFHIVLANKLIYLVGELFTGRVSLKQVQGPLGIVQESSRAAKRGFGDLISLMALVSLNLAILTFCRSPSSMAGIF